MQFTAMPLQQSFSPEQTASSNIKDLRHLSEADKAAYLLKEEQQMREAQQDDQRVFLLRNTEADIRGQIKGLSHGMFDIDGTTTGVGNSSIYPKNITEIIKLRGSNFTPVAITGRHYWQVEELWRNHPGGIGIDEWLIEQGFFRTDVNGQPEIFAGSETLLQSVINVRTVINRVLQQISDKNNVDFVTTSEAGFPAAHQSMVSYDVQDRHTKEKITPEQKNLHDNIFDCFKDIWNKHDPNGKTAKIGTSSIGTIEWTLDGINKERALQKWKDNRNIASRNISFWGDSSNDLAVMQSPEDYFKVVIVNPHTKQKLIEGAHIATIGIGNAAPALSFVRGIREQKI